MNGVSMHNFVANSGADCGSLTSLETVNVDETAAIRSQGGADEVIHRCSRSFSLASRFLPANLRAQVIALYAWCRCVDDAVDQAGDDTEAARTLAVLEADLYRAVTGLAVQHPASAWIQPLLASGSIEIQHARELIEGMRMDLNHDRVETDADLEQYCYHAAGTVGLMMTRLMGVCDRAADRHAIALGLAMQLTNIARDVREDAEHGRSYLPGIAQPLTTDPAAVKASVAGILATAERHYCTAEDGLKYLPWNCRPAIRVALSVYREIGREIQRQDYAVLNGRTTIRRSRLFHVAILALFASLADDIRFAFTRFQNSLTRSLKELIMVSTNSTSSLNPATLEISTPRQAKQVVYLGLSLTLIMATALFVMVFVNPKSAEYSFLPLVYAGLSLVGSIVFNRLSAGCEAAALAVSPIRTHLP